MNHHEGFVHSLAEPVFWVALGVCIIAEIAILRSSFVPHHGSQESASMPHSQRGIEMIWAILPAIGLVILLAATWRAVNH